MFVSKTSKIFDLLSRRAQFHFGSPLVAGRVRKKSTRSNARPRLRRHGKRGSGLLVPEPNIVRLGGQRLLVADAHAVHVPKLSLTIEARAFAGLPGRVDQIVTAFAQIVATGGSHQVPDCCAGDRPDRHTSCKIDGLLD